MVMMMGFMVFMVFIIITVIKHTNRDSKNQCIVLSLPIKETLNPVSLDLYKLYTILLC